METHERERRQTLFFSFVCLFVFFFQAVKPLFRAPGCLTDYLLRRNCQETVVCSKVLTKKPTLIRNCLINFTGIRSFCAKARCVWNFPNHLTEFEDKCTKRAPDDKLSIICRCDLYVRYIDYMAAQRYEISLRMLNKYFTSQAAASA